MHKKDSYKGKDIFYPTVISTYNDIYMEEVRKSIRRQLYLEIIKDIDQQLKECFYKWENVHIPIEKSDIKLVYNLDIRYTNKIFEKDRDATMDKVHRKIKKIFHYGYQYNSFLNRTTFIIFQGKKWQDYYMKYMDDGKYTMVKRDDPLEYVEAKEENKENINNIIVV